MGRALLHCGKRSKQYHRLANYKTNKLSKSFDTAKKMKRYYDPEVYRYALQTTEGNENIQNNTDSSEENDEQEHNQADIDIPQESADQGTYNRLFPPETS